MATKGFVLAAHAGSSFMAVQSLASASGSAANGSEKEGRNGSGKRSDSNDFEMLVRDGAVHL